MRIILPSAFQTQPWKNGGGTTHEIARAERDGRFLWRLSIAEVATDGPFSAFPGLSRILTVIEGAGLWLDTPERTLDALPLRPVAFSGDLAVSSRMIGGPIRDFNLIWDGERIDGAVTLPAGAPAFSPCGIHMLLALGDGVTADITPLPRGAVAIWEGEAGHAVTPANAALLVTLTPH